MRRFSGVTTTQLARMCGVSQGTVDRALHNREGISKKTKEKILSVAREYEYLPSVTNAAPGKSMLIGVVLFDLYNAFFSKLAMSLVNIARRDGYSVIFLFSNKSLDEERSAIDYFNYIGVDGIILFSVGSDRVEYKNYLESIKRPLLTIGNRLFDIDHVGIDDYAAMYELTEKMLLATGAGEITYFAPVLRSNIHEKNAQLDRKRGFVDAMRASGRPYRFAYSEDELSADSIGIVCSTDYYALRVSSHFGAESDAWIAGFDNAAMPQSADGKTFTVDYSTDDIAAECMNYLLRRKYQSKINYSVLCDAQFSLFY